MRRGNTKGHDMEKIPEPRLVPREAAMPRCPVCGEETNDYFRDLRGDICGCPECVESIDAWRMTESR